MPFEMPFLGAQAALVHWIGWGRSNNNGGDGKTIKRWMVLRVTFRECIRIKEVLLLHIDNYKRMTLVFTQMMEAF